MTIDFVREDNDICVSVKGRLDTVTAPDFENFLNDNLGASGFLTVDCSELDYISSAGLRVLLYAQKKTEGAMKLIGVSELILEVLDMTGFSDILRIE